MFLACVCASAPIILCRVPSTQLGRALGFAGMGASLLFGSITDSVSRTLGGGSSSTSDGSNGSSSGVYSNFITESNAERLANALCRMRGAALKIGQMLSIQDETVLPPQVRDMGWWGVSGGRGHSDASRFQPSVFPWASIM